jgi:transcription initiation factor TFIIB
LQTTKTSKALKCQQCGNEKLIEDDEKGEIFCPKCGLIASSQPALVNNPPYDDKLIDHEPEKLVYKGTVILPTVGRLKKEEVSNAMALARMQRKYIYSEERTLRIGMRYIDASSSRLLLPKNVKMEAISIFQKAVEKGLVKGRDIPAMASASLMIACRKFRTIRSSSEIIACESRKRVSGYYRLLVTELNIKLPFPSPVDFISKIVNNLDPKPSQDVVRRAIEILNTLREMHTGYGRRPECLAAAAIYIAAEEMGAQIHQREIAMAAGVVDVSVRNSCRVIRECLKNVKNRVERNVIIS